MRLSRRRCLYLAAGAAALPGAPRSAIAETYPTRPIHLVVGFPPGGGVDIVARLIGQWLSERLGQQVVVDNKPGAGGNIATETVVRAAPDGYTLTYVGPVAAINASFYKHLGFDFIRDIAPVASFMRAPVVMVVNPLVPARTVPEFIAYAKANPGKINMASSGNGTPGHVFGELFKMMTSVDMVHVPYRGNPLPDLLGGQVQLMFNPIPSTIEFIRSGKLRALAVTTATRQEVLPDIPTVGEFVSGYEASGFIGIGAPKGTPAEVIDRLNTEINGALADPQMTARLADLGGAAMPMSPAEFGKFIAEETEKWAKVIKFANIKPD